MSNILDITNKSCMGCGVCKQVCPTKAIDIVKNENGFYEATIDNTKCINCGKCVKVCVRQDDFTNITPIKCYSAVNVDKELIKKSSSAGIASSLATEAIKQGYKVIGIAYNYDKNIAESIIVERKEDLYKLRGSKYFHTTLSGSLDKIDKESKYLFIGTPCQIKAVDKWTRSLKIRENFLLVDFFCHGIPSVDLWTKYLDYVNKKTGVKKYDNIEFRSKAYGWHSFATKFEYEGKTYVSPKVKDRFYDLFLSKEYFNKTCYGCNYRSNLEHVDIRLGDFWGRRYDSNTEGISVVVIGSKKGQDFFSGLSDIDILEEVSLNEVMDFQSARKKHAIDINKLNTNYQFLREHTINDTWKKHIHSLTLKQKIKRELKIIASVLPRKYIVKFRLSNSKKNKGEK